MTSEHGSGSPDRLAPVIPLFGDEPRGDEPRPPADAARQAARAVAPWHTTWEDQADDEYDFDECTLIEAEIAERNLLRKLRTRQLSVSEARAVLAERDLEPHDIDTLLHVFVRRGYLDDLALAEQLARGAAERKGQGRLVIAQSLAKRGIPRDVTDAVLAALPDDDAERALEFARQKARTMRGLEHDVALRRLAGQLARRGYGGAALDAARRALDEL